MSRSDSQRLCDILAACAAIESHLGRGEVSDDVVFDAIRIRLVEIGEAVKELDPKTTARAPSVPWAGIARMCDQLAHRYFDNAHSIVDATAQRDIPLLREATQRTHPTLRGMVLARFDDVNGLLHADRAVPKPTPTCRCSNPRPRASLSRGTASGRSRR